MQEGVYSKQAMNEVDAGFDLATPVEQEESWLCSNLIHRFALNKPSSFSSSVSTVQGSSLNSPNSGIGLFYADSGFFDGKAARNARLIGILGQTQVAHASSTLL